MSSKVRRTEAEQRLRGSIETVNEKVIEKLRRDGELNGTVLHEDLLVTYYEDLLQQRRPKTAVTPKRTETDKGVSSGERTYELLSMWAAAESVLWNEAMQSLEDLKAFRREHLDDVRVDAQCVYEWVESRATEPNADANEEVRLSYSQLGGPVRFLKTHTDDEGLLHLARLVSLGLDAGIPWHAHQMLNMILTGLVPAVLPVAVVETPPVVGDTCIRQHRLVRVSPMASAPAIAYALSELLPPAGRMNEADDFRLAHLAAFAVQRLGWNPAKWPRRGWAALHREWKQLHPEMAYASDYKFKEGANRAVSRFVAPPSSERPGPGVVDDAYLACDDDDGYAGRWNGASFTVKRI